jgi:ribosome-associated translation inhibitor RaiA
METQWRILQSQVKTASPAKWKAIDEALDRVERELRFWRVRRSDSAEALQALIDAIDSRT